MSGKSSSEVYFVFAIFTVCFAQLLRIYRWKLMVYKDGEISNRVLSRSIGLSYLANLILPFRMGEVVRIVYLKHKKFGIFATAFSVFLERLLDSIFITLFFGVYFYFRIEDFRKFFLFSSAVTIGFLAILYLAIRPQKRNLKFLRIFSGEWQLKLNLLFFQLYLVVRSIKHNIKKIIGTSILINLSIFTSIVFFSAWIEFALVEISEILVFDLSNSILVASAKLHEISNNGVLIIVYLIFPILLLMIPSFREFTSKKPNSAKIEVDSIRNLVVPENRSPDSDEYFKEAVLKIASEGKSGLSKIQTETLQGGKVIEVLQGGGSGDEVYLVRENERMKVRKSALLSRRDFLIEQNNWMRKNNAILPIVETSELILTESAAYYDMEYLGKESSLFEIMHSTDIETCQIMFNKLLSKLNANGLEISSPDMNHSYAMLYTDKMVSSFDWIHREGVESFLTQQLIVDGVSLRRFEIIDLLNFLSNQTLPESVPWLMHGDLTVSNLMVKSEEIVLIDPNPIQPFNHASVDFGKLLQSFKCGYEFDFKHPQIIGTGKSTSILQTRSHVYAQMENYLYGWIGENSKADFVHHSRIQLILHLMRIVPYTSNRDQLIWIIFQVRICFTEILG